MSYYHGLISSRRASALLTSQGDGSFLIRDSQSQPGSFVLSVKSAGRVYHVLIFHQAGQYHMDSDEEGEEAMFDSLDDLVVFCMAHEMRVEGAEVQLREAVPCAEEAGAQVKAVSFAPRKTSRGEDSDQLTDLFATLFGARSTVVCVAHSSMSFDGQALEEGVELLALVVKDSQQKGFFIRVVDPEKRVVVGEKRITKTFQYDTPGELVMTYLSQHGITCVGFSDARERDRFLRQVDRVVRLQQDKAMRVRARGDSETKPVQSPTGLSHKIKASQFDIDHLTPEWQYLFDQAGVTRAMLEDQRTLQFILDTVYKIGGAPLQLDTVREEAVMDAPMSNGDSAVQQRRRERLQVLAVDHTLRHESFRASKLSQELQSQSLQHGTITPHTSSCSHLTLCERFKDNLMMKNSLFALGPEEATCFCEQCAAGRPVVQVAGSPPQQYSLPLGWSHFVHRSRSHVLARQFCARWHVAYCSVPSSRVAGVMRTGQLPHSHSSGEVLLSPDIQCACKITSFTPAGYYDEETDQQYRVSTAFQVYIQPESYSVRVADEEGSGSSLLQTNFLWHAPERTYIVHALLIKMAPY